MLVVRLKETHRVHTHGFAKLLLGGCKSGSMKGENAVLILPSVI